MQAFGVLLAQHVLDMYCVPNNEQYNISKGVAADNVSGLSRAQAWHSHVQACACLGLC